MIMKNYYIKTEFEKKTAVGDIMEICHSTCIDIAKYSTHSFFKVVFEYF